jgi:hypothetical protein
MIQGCVAGKLTVLDPINDSEKNKASVLLRVSIRYPFQDNQLILLKKNSKKEFIKTLI